MATIDNTKFRSDTGGKAAYIKHYIVGVNNFGYTIDISCVQFEDRIGVSRHFMVINSGEFPIYVAFDSHHLSIDVDDKTTYNIFLRKSAPFNQIKIDGEASLFSFKCYNSDISTAELIVW